MQSQAGVRGAGWEESIAVTKAVWLPRLLIGGEGRDSSRCFQLFWHIKKKIRDVSHRSSSHFPGVGFYVTIASSTARFLD